MSTDLSAKFTALETQLSLQYNQLIIALNLQVEKLSSIAQVLTFMYADTTEQVAQLTALRAAVAPAAETLPAGEKVSVAWALYRLMDAIAPAWPRPVSQPVQPSLESVRTMLTTSLGVNETGLAEDSLLGRLIQLIDNVGLPTGDATTTVLGRLAAIQRQQLLCCFSSDPAVVDPSGCTSPIASQAPAVSDAAFPGRLFVRWPDMTAQGVVFTDDFGLTATAVEISPEATWSGWKLFVGSKTAAVYSEDPTRSGYWPTNQWRDLTEAQGFHLAISVATGQDVTAYLCPPVPEPEPECVQADATFDNVNIVWIAANPNTNSVFWNGDYRNYRIRIVGTYTGGALPRVHCYRYPGDTSLGSLIMNPEFGTSEFTITTPGNEPIAFITIFSFAPNGGAQFTVEVCKPLL